MDWATLGGLLVGFGTLAGGVLAWLGKRGENSNNRMNSEMDQIQEERDGYRAQCAEKDAKIASLLEQRVTDQVKIAQLRVRIVELGGDPS